MIARIRKSMEEKDQGFTLIELLVVMVIIGILSAIAVPVFLSQRNKAYDTAAKSDVANIGREVATYATDNTLASTNGITAPSVGTWQLSGTGLTGDDVPNGRTSTGVSLGTPKFTSATVWCVAVTSKSAHTFTYSNTGPSAGTAAVC